MKASLFVPLLAGALLVGCGDGGKSSSSSSGNPAAAPAEYLGAMAKAEQKAVKTSDVAALTRAIQMFEADQGRLPKDLNEVVAMKYIARLPEAPAGQKLDYDPNTGTVKVVPK
ncbi:MAG TPA: hypothetical protein VFV96_07280 [Verrucomicrobiae bacterium]|nr:hypothetical protein [Verrucomicrobiae bacterium]